MDDGEWGLVPTPAKLKPLWQCPKCGERFVTAHMWHSCGKYSLNALFARSEPRVLQLFRKFADLVKACGPVRMIPRKTLVVFQARVRFAGAVPRHSSFLCSLALRRRYQHPRFLKVETYASRFHGHRLRIESEKDFDAELRRWIHEAYGVGEQTHLGKHPA